MKTGFERLGTIILVVAVAGLSYAGGRLISGDHEKAATPPPGATTKQEDPNAPKSVMNYGQCEAGQDCTLQTTIPCYVNTQLADFRNELIQQKGNVLVAHATLTNGDALEIFRQPADGSFTTLVTGPDKTGQTEGCIVATGTGYESLASLEAVNPASSGPAPQSVTPPAAQ